MPWLEFLKTRGHKIALVDPSQNPPCLKSADLFIRCDVKDVVAIERSVRELGIEIELVTSDQTDVSVLPVAHLSKVFGTRGNSLATVELFANKLSSRRFIENRFGVHIPRFKPVLNAGEVVEMCCDTGRDIIVKPVDAQSSRGIFLVKHDAKMFDLEDRFSACIKYSSARQVIAEEYVQGTEITIEGICLAGRHTITAMSRKQHFRLGIASDLLYPLKINQDLHEQLVDFHCRLIESTGLDFGITHSEYIINEIRDEFWLVEMACRGGGSLIPSHITPAVSGINIYKSLYDYIMSGSNNIQAKRFVDPIGSCLLHFFEFQSGRIQSMDGIDECKSMDSVVDLGLEFKVGDILSPATDDRSRQGYVIIKGCDECFVKRQLEAVEGKIKVGYYKV